MYVRINFVSSNYVQQQVLNALFTSCTSNFATKFNVETNE